MRKKEPPQAMLETVIISYYRGTTQIDKCPLSHVLTYTPADNGSGLRQRLLSKISSCPPESIHNYHAVASHQPATL